MAANDVNSSMALDSFAQWLLDGRLISVLLTVAASDSSEVCSRFVPTVALVTSALSLHNVQDCGRRGKIKDEVENVQ